MVRSMTEPKRELTKAERVLEEMMLDRMNKGIMKPDYEKLKNKNQKKEETPNQRRISHKVR